MKIKKLQMKNFCKFEDAKIEFHPNFNVLIGMNGCGKTTICNAIIESLSDLIGFLTGTDIRLENRSKNTTRYSFPQEKSKEYHFPTKLKIKVSTHLWGLQSWIVVKEDIEEALQSPHEFSIDHMKYNSDLKKRVADGEDVVLPLLIAYGIPRIQKSTSPHKFHNVVESRFDVYRQCFRKTYATTSFFNWLYRQFLIEVSEKQEDVLLQVVRNAIQQAVPDCVDIQYNPRMDDVLVTTKDIQENERKFSFCDLSDGYQNMIGMIADIAHQAARLNPHLGENVLNETTGIVLIDELDLHLHPKWQRTIVATLRKIFPNIQFITTTHSPLIVSEVQPESVIILKDTENGFQWFHPEAAYGQTLDALIEDVFEEKNILIMLKNVSKNFSRQSNRTDLMKPEKFTIR